MSKKIELKDETANGIIKVNPYGGCSEEVLVTGCSTRESVRERPYLVGSKAESKKISVEINNDSISLPIELKTIADQIEEAKELLQFNFDWDEEGAIATNAETFGQAAHFLIKYALYLQQTNSTILTTPYIDILKDGSISIHWDNPKSQFLIIFKKESVDLAYYYAELKDTKVPFKSAIKIGNPIDKHLAIWMNEHLT